MNPKPKIGVVIPAFNEERSIGHVVDDIPKEWVEDIVVISNRSTDKTIEVATKAGATVLSEERRGYGYACLKGIDYLTNLQTPPDIIVFLDGDYSDYPEELPDVVAPIIEDDIDLVIGSRATGQREAGAMQPQQIFGNSLATTLMQILYGSKFTDLGPFRAIKTDKLQELGMVDKTYGWTVEMQVKALKNKLTYTEIPARYRVRIGDSKVSGTFKGTIMAGYKIIGTIFRYL